MLNKICLISMAFCLLFMVGCGDNSVSVDNQLTDGKLHTTAVSNMANSIIEQTTKKEISEEIKDITELDIVYLAEIDIRDYGVIKVKLNQKEAPITVSNFITLANDGFYDGLTFHRIKDGFMMQGGCPEGTGFGGSGKSLVGEFKENGVDNNISHVRGTISMARSDAFDSASSQFFIVNEDSIFLDGKYAGFGEVVDGMDVVDKICESAVPVNDNGIIMKEQQPIINTIKIITEE